MLKTLHFFEDSEYLNVISALQLAVHLLLLLFRWWLISSSIFSLTECLADFKQIAGFVIFPTRLSVYNLNSFCLIVLIQLFQNFLIEIFWLYFLAHEKPNKQQMMTTILVWLSMLHRNSLCRNLFCSCFQIKIRLLWIHFSGDDLAFVIISFM